ncbi:hypothetical protein [Streptomyces sp. JJ66]|nr:hypothetical protein [Streptomyces sp. JJ66]
MNAPRQQAVDHFEETRRDYRYKVVTTRKPGDADLTAHTPGEPTA